MRTNPRWFVASSILPILPLIFAVYATGDGDGDRDREAELSGTISSTLTIFDDTRLVGDVTCTAAVATAPCIVFGASHIKLRLNGHTITGPVNPLTNLASCSKPTDSSFGVALKPSTRMTFKSKGP